MKKLLSIIALFCTLTAAAQFATPVKFTVKENKVSDTELEVVFTGKIDAGWHVYGTDIKDGGPTKAEVTLEKQKGLKPKGSLKGKGSVHKAMDDMFGMEVSYYEGSVTFVQAFTITEAQYEVEGYLTYGACNDQNCIPPTDVDFKFSGTGKPAAQTQTQPPLPPKGGEKEAGDAEKKVNEKADDAKSAENAVEAVVAEDGMKMRGHTLVWHNQTPESL